MKILRPSQDGHVIFPIRRPVTTAMIFITLLVFGANSYQKLSLNLMPEISYPTLTVRTEFEGAAPEDVEQLLTEPLEETLSTTGGMRQISSISSPGISEVMMEFAWDTDMGDAQQDVRDRLDLFATPKGVTEKPVILRYDPTLDPVMRIAITGSDLSGVTDPGERTYQMQQEMRVVREAAERRIKNDLEGEGGIAQVQVKGGREDEIQVLVDSERLKSLGLPLSAVVNALAMQNISLSGGRLREGRTEYLVRTLNEFQDLDEIGDSLIPMPLGSAIRLKDIAVISVGQLDQETMVRINGQDAVELAIYKWGDANTVEVCNKLKDLLGFEREPSLVETMSKAIRQSMSMGSGTNKDAERAMELAKTIKSRLPEFARMVITSDQSTFIKAALNEVKNSAIEGGFLALIILFFFLRQIRTTFIIGVSIPLSILATFVPMFLQEISLNIMSLGGIALGIGMLVDDSIIVLESIARCREEGDDPVQAANRGTREVYLASSASTFTTIVVFLPIAFVEGIAGQMFRDLALTVTYSLLASLSVALILIPMLAAQQGIPLSSARGVIWMLRAYREGRTAGAGIPQSFLGVFYRYLPLYTVRWIHSTSRETFAPLRHAASRSIARTDHPLMDIMAKLLWLFIPFQALFLSLLLLVAIILKVFVSVFVLIAFIIGGSVAGVLWLVGALFRIVLYIPLRLFDIAFNAFRDSYTSSLRALLPMGPAIVVLTILLSIHCVWLAPRLGQELIPPLKQGEFGIRMEAPPGTRLEETAGQAAIIEETALSVPEVETVALEVGQEKTNTTGERGENIARLTIRLKDPKVNAPRQDDIIKDLRARLAGKTSNTLSITLPSLFSFKTAVEVQVRGDDLTTLRRVGQDVVEHIQGIQGLADPDLTMKQGYPEVIIRLDRDMLAERGITPDQVAQRLRTEVQGDLATRFNRAGQKVDIRVRADRNHLNTLDDLRQLSIVDGDPPIPLEAVAEIVVQDGPSEVRRIDQREVAIITANVEGRDLGSVTEEIKQRVANVECPRDYQFIFGGQNKELESSYASMQFAAILALFLVYVVMACQFESIIQPLLIMTTVPMAFIGVVYVLYLSGISISIMVFIGGIVLSGVVVNDAIILLDYINQLRRRGHSKSEAVVLAGRVRLRPIMMTTLTTVLGLIPMAIGTGEGSEMRGPMAITIMAGLSSATLLTLYIIPMVYHLFARDDHESSEEAG